MPGKSHGLGIFASLQVQPLSKQCRYGLLSSGTQMFIVGIIHGLLGVHLAQFGQRVDNVYIGPCGKALTQARQAVGAALACAASGGRQHPAIALWPVALRKDLRRALVEEGVHKVGDWSARYARAIAEWRAEPIDPFFNVNTPDDVADAERLAALYPEA